MLPKCMNLRIIPRFILGDGRRAGQTGVGKQKEAAPRLPLGRIYLNKKCQFLEAQAEVNISSENPGETFLKQA